MGHSKLLSPEVLGQVAVFLPCQRWQAGTSPNEMVVYSQESQLCMEIFTLPFLIGPTWTINILLISSPFTLNDIKHLQLNAYYSRTLKNKHTNTHGQFQMVQCLLYTSYTHIYILHIISSFRANNSTYSSNHQNHLLVCLYELGPCSSRKLGFESVRPIY